MKPLHRKLLYAFTALAVIILILWLWSLRDPSHITYTEDVELLDYPVQSELDPTRGATEPSVTIVHFGHYSCLDCAEIAQALVHILNDYPEVQVIWKDFPNQSLFPESIDAAVAARCAQEQGEFWDYHDQLFSGSEPITDELLLSIAENLDLKSNKFKRCLEGLQTLDVVQASYSEALKLNLIGAPTLYINDERYTGAMSESELRQIIESELAS